MSRLISVGIPAGNVIYLETEVVLIKLLRIILVMLCIIVYNYNDNLFSCNLT
jgi:hypothetical protein